jgi:hypothetical protein
MIIEYPQFRKLSNEKSYYKIDSATELTEIQRVGEKFLVHQLQAKILPEKLLISDLIACDSSNYSIITAEEYLDFEEFCNRELHRY